MCRQAKGGGSGGNGVPPAVDIIETRVKIRLYTPKTENRLCDAESDELMAMIKLPSRMGLAFKFDQSHSHSSRIDSLQY
jgi:hypothetical protein